MRLIDADKMKIGLSEKTKTDSEASRFIDIIDGQSTAYDLDKVVEQLREKSFISGDRIGVSDLKIVMAEKAIEIVKSGGVQDDY